MSVRFGDESWPEDTQVLHSVSQEIGDDDLPALQGIPGLLELALLDTDRHRRIVHPITDLSPLAELTELRVLELPRSTVADLAPLRALNHLRRLDVAFTRVADVTPLLELPGLEWVKLTGAPAADDGPGVQALRDRGVEVIS